MQDQTIPFRPVDVRTSAPSYSVAPGNRVTVDFSVVNHTGREDYFDITVEGIPSNWILLDIPVIHLADEEQRDFTLSVQTPDHSPLSAGVYPVSLRASSQTNPKMQGDTGFNLQVGAYEATQVMTPFEQNGSIALRMDARQLSVAPGDSLTVPLVLINQGAFDESFYLSVEGLPDDWVSLPVTAIRLLPGEARELAFMIQPPMAPASRAGRHTIRVRVSSQSDPARAAVADAVLTVPAVNQFVSDLNPRHMDAGRTARLRIHNLSNIQDTYQLRFQSHGDDLEFVPASSGPLRVLPGETVAVDFAVSPRSPNWLGGPSVLPYTVLVTSSSGEVQSHNGDVVSRSLIPVWMLPAVLVLCIAALCGTSLLWNWNQQRLTIATETADAAVAMVQAGTATAIYNQTAAALAGQQDTDGDGLVDAQEQDLGLNPSLSDTDSDRISDGSEVQTGLDPRNPDSDGDGVIDGFDLSPLDPTNPLLTATAQAAIIALPSPTTAPTNTVAPLPTHTQPPTQAPPQPTLTRPAPSLTSTATQPPTLTPPLPTASLTSAPVVEATPTGALLPVTGQQNMIFASDREGSLDIYVLDLSDGSTQRLTDHPGADTQPAVSPDGQRLLFTTDRDGNNEIYLMGIDGSDPVNLTANPASDSDPAWSPDGGQIVFTTDRDGQPEVYRMNEDGGDPLNLSNSPASDTQPVWVETGGLLNSSSQVLFTTNRDENNEIYAVDPDGENLVNLTNHPASDTQPDVPASGGPVVFVSDRDGNPDIFRMGVDGADPVNLTQSQAAEDVPAISADGSWMVYTQVTEEGGQEIMIVETGGGEPFNLTDSPAQDVAPDLR